jgi:hypothetical protein
MVLLDSKENHMNLNSKIPQGFYKLFASKYMEYYQQFLVAIYEESGRSYSLLGLTERECRAIMNERIAMETLDWSEEQFDEEGELLTRANMASICLRHLEDWGWLKRDYDDVLNSYVVSFPEYSQLFVELFQQLYSEDSTKERESVLAVYSHLYTYSSDKEKNNEILKSALQTSRGLLHMLSNMQEGMRGYFDELSRQRSFLGIQEVLVKEINNSDSQKYAILTTTDSFYRYKEAVKELIEQNLTENEDRKQNLEEQLAELERISEEPSAKLSANPMETIPGNTSSNPMETIPGNASANSLENISVNTSVNIYTNPSENTLRNRMARRRLERNIRLCEEATDIIYRIEREFNAIERRYNKLIEQKTIFASRAAARIRYILMEGDVEEDQTAVLVNLLNHSIRKEEILEKLAEKMQLTERFHVITERSLFRRRDMEKTEFAPQAITADAEQDDTLDAFVLKPLYTKQEITEFRKANEQDGRFQVTKDTVQSIEDLEKLFFVWQEATEIADQGGKITVGQELESEEGYRFSKLHIE